jgi:hypothetical protein
MFLDVANRELIIRPLRGRRPPWVGHPAPQRRVTDVRPLRGYAYPRKDARLCVTNKR